MNRNLMTDSGPLALRPGRDAGLVLRYRKAIVFLVAAMCLAGAYSAWTMPASVFPETNFPRVD